jgi:hypothetical protein
LTLDPTGTGKLRSRFRAEAQLRYRRLLSTTRAMLVSQDPLAMLKTGTDEQKLQAFANWFSGMAYHVVVAGGTWMRPHLDAAYASGVEAGGKQTGVRTPLAINPVFYEAARVELEGIVDFATQRVVRASVEGITRGLSSTVVYRSVLTAARAAEPRLNMLANQFVVALHNEALLDQFKAAGVARVGLIPEHLPRKPVTTDAAKGPGSRGGKSASTIGRIQKVQSELDKLGTVEVLTAGDNDVCDECEAIAANGPYDIEEAYGLIPAHPNCRCAFVPSEDARYADPEPPDPEDLIDPIEEDTADALTVDYNENHDPDTGEFSEGDGGGTFNNETVLHAAPEGSRHERYGIEPGIKRAKSIRGFGACTECAAAEFNKSGAEVHVGNAVRKDRYREALERFKKDGTIIGTEAFPHAWNVRNNRIIDHALGSESAREHLYFGTAVPHDHSRSSSDIVKWHKSQSHKETHR